MSKARELSVVPNQYFNFKNRIINGAMMIDQRNAGASVTPTATTYTLDRWHLSINNSSKLSVQQSSTAPAGFNNSLLLTSLAATTVGATDYYQLRHRVEGYNVADLGFGTANASTITVSFWVRSSLTGTFSFSLINDAENRFYPATYTINSANTWEQKTITIAGDVTGTWAKTNGTGLFLNFVLGLGSAYATSTTNSWVSSNGYGVSSTTNLVSTNGATFYITGVQLEKGSTATSFDYRPYGTELALCQRYYQTINKMTGIGQGGSSAVIYSVVEFPVTMRTTPSIGQTGVFAFEIPFGTASTQSSTSATLASGNTNTGIYFYMSNFSGLTGGQMYMKHSNTNLLTLSAEL